jgi:hypothetical protein
MNLSAPAEKIGTLSVLGTGGVNVSPGTASDCTVNLKGGSLNIFARDTSSNQDLYKLSYHRIQITSGSINVKANGPTEHYVTSTTPITLGGTLPG